MRLHGWHEYLTFVMSLQAVFTAITTLVWVLVVNVPDDETAGEPR